MLEFIQNLMEYCYKLDEHSWPYAEITLHADGSGHVEYGDEVVFSFRTKENWEEDNKELLKKLNE